VRGDRTSEGKSGVAVIGLGHVGLAVAVAAAEAGHTVFGVDTDPERVSNVQAGAVADDADVRARLASVLGRGLALRASLDAVPACDIYLVCVPTPLTASREPDLRPLEKAAGDVAKRLTAGDLVVVESTSFPGTTQGVVRPILERSGLSALSDFDLVCSPERIDPGNRRFSISNTPKVVAGVDERSTKRAAAFYSTFCDEIIESTGIREVELSKLIENSYRNINIAFVNELAVLAADAGIDLQEALRCAATKPFGFEAFFPGSGVGGQCIPVDPTYLSHWARQEAGSPLPTLEAAQRANDERPVRIAEVVRNRLVDITRDGGIARVLIVGVAYKARSADVRNSPADDVYRVLRDGHTEIGFWDPLVDAWSCDGQAIPRWEIAGSSATKVDVAVVLQPHDANELAGLSENAAVVVDSTHTVEDAEYV